MTQDEQDCFNKLQAWIARFDELMSLYERDRPFVPSAQVARARDLYAKLKADLDIEQRRLNNSRLRHTEAERRWYATTLHSARGHLRAPTNARPETWHSDLYNSRGDFFADLLAMKQHFGVAD
jgi:hypothetical protein